jgi:hypothetical protein
MVVGLWPARRPGLLANQNWKRWRRINSRRLVEYCYPSSPFTFEAVVVVSVTELPVKGLNMPIYEKIPEGLVEGYGGPCTSDKNPVTMLSASDNGALSDQPKRGNYGVLPEKPDPKRMRSGSLQPNKVTAPTKQSTHVHEDRCCNCSKTSTCQTKRCACFLGGTPCRSCNCKERCKDLKVIKNP